VLKNGEVKAIFLSSDVSGDLGKTEKPESPEMLVSERALLLDARVRKAPSIKSVSREGTRRIGRS